MAIFSYPILALNDSNSTMLFSVLSSRLLSISQVHQPWSSVFCLLLSHFSLYLAHCLNVPHINFLYGLDQFPKPVRGLFPFNCRSMTPLTLDQISQPVKPLLQIDTVTKYCVDLTILAIPTSWSSWRCFAMNGRELSF